MSENVCVWESRELSDYLMPMLEDPWSCSLTGVTYCWTCRPRLSMSRVPISDISGWRCQGERTHSSWTRQWRQIIRLPIIHSWVVDSRDRCTVFFHPWDDQAWFLQGCMTLGARLVTDVSHCCGIVWLHSDWVSLKKGGAVVHSRFGHSELHNEIRRLAYSYDHVPWTVRDWNSPPQPGTLAYVPIAREGWEVHQTRKFLTWLDRGVGPMDMSSTALLMYNYLKVPTFNPGYINIKPLFCTVWLK